MIAFFGNFSLLTIFINTFEHGCFGIGSFSELKMALRCRFYEQKYPEIDEVVMVNVRWGYPPDPTDGICVLPLGLSWESRRKKNEKEKYRGRKLKKYIYFASWILVIFLFFMVSYLVFIHKFIPASWCPFGN